VYRPRWSPDGKWLVFQTDPTQSGAGDILGIRPGIDSAPVALVATGFTEVSPALSPDGLWRWTGLGWVPARATAAPSGAGRAVGLTIGLVLAFLGVLVLVAILVAAILYTMGNQISNVFSNVAAALGT
jgi:hypothetical protein